MPQAELLDQQHRHPAGGQRPGGRRPEQARPDHRHFHLGHGRDDSRRRAPRNRPADYDNVPGNGTLAAAWNGTAWSINATPNPAVGGVPSVVSCTSASGEARL